MRTAWLTKPWLWIGVGVLVVTVGVALVFLLRGNKTEEGTLNKALKSADQLTGVGNYDQALATLQQAQKDAQGTDQQLWLLSNLAAAAANAGKVSEALGYYAQKHQLNPGTTAADGMLVGELYERLGETQKAIEQYETYLGYITANPTEEDAQARTDSLTARITQLKEGL